MSDWKSIFDGVFFITIATILTGSFGLSIRYCLKSKCERFSFCFGLFEIFRRVDLEVQHELAQLEMGIHNDDNHHDQTNSPVPKMKLPKKRIVKENNIEFKEDEIIDI